MIGTTISHYEILEKLGSGGMGVVYKAHDTRLKRTVALKFLPPDLTRDAEAKQRFIHEAQAASALQHNNICTIHDIDETDDGRLFIVMDCYEGESLTSRIATGPMQAKEAVDVALHVASGLSKAHEKGIVHRDIKPGNVFITTDGTVKILDFGLAKLAGGQTRLTRAGSTLGTAAYMSPEQAQGLEVDQKTDIWSLGVVLFEMLTGKLPFRGDHEAALAYSVVNEEPIPARRLRADIPTSLETIVVRCLEKDPAKRFQATEDMIVQLRKLQEEKRDPAHVLARRSRVLWLAASAIVILGAILFYVYILPPERSAERKSIAVLPFKNLSDSKQDEYFSDGVTEEIITNLSKIGDLKVTSRTSIMRYKSTDKGLREIARELGVSVILDGSVRRAGDRVRITGQLIDAESDEHIWAETYDLDMKDVFAIQTDVAEKIALAFRASLSPEEKTKLHVKPTESLSAHDLFLRGRYEWRQRTQESLQNAASFFHQAVALDPNYALAHVGLADCYALYPYYGITVLSRAEAYDRAENSVRKALAINPQLAEAHCSLGNILKDWKWDWKGAEREFKRAIELDPAYATAHQWYSECLGAMGSLEASLTEAKRAYELEPFTPVIAGNVSLALTRLRKYDEAIQQSRKTTDLDPVFPSAHRVLTRLYYLKRQFRDAAEEVRRAGAPAKVAEIFLIEPPDSGRLTRHLRSFQMPDEWKYLLVEILATHGLNNRALEVLSELIDEKNPELQYLVHSPALDALSLNSRFLILMKKMGLEK
ncbi:MAG: protein kinase [Ignavibacteria bacterium]|nr:protein kinase [Ignavibacteria bacterium]